MSITIPRGTRIYLTKNKGPEHAVYIKPGTTLNKDNMYIAHDIKIGPVIVIRKGTRVSGDWITELNPSIVGQLQINKIYFNSRGQDFFADSDPIRTTTIINPAEIDNANNIIKNADYRSISNIPRRIVTVKCKTYALLDSVGNYCTPLETYLNINTNEIPATVISDLIINFV